MSDNDNLLISFAIGEGNNFAKSENKVESWGRFIDSLSVPIRTGEPRLRYDKMPDQRQIHLKSINGWISGAQCKGKWRRATNILPRDLITLDIDYAREDIMERIENQDTGISEYEFFTHSSRRHTSEFPRLRLFIPLTHKVDKEAYGPLARIVGWMFEGRPEYMEEIDRVSARVAQMMFKPTVSQDGEFYKYRNLGEVMDPDAILDAFEEEVGDWRDIDNWPLFKKEKKLRISADKAEDPKSKDGPIGAFCRAYDIEEAMEKFLPGVYIPVDDHSAKPRYSFAGATTTNGAVVEDDGLFLYSHHSSDPCCEQLVNAFDLVRIHLFGSEDDDTDLANTKMFDRPSVKAMLEHLDGDEKYAKERAKEKYDVTAMFEELGDDTDHLFDDMLDEDDEEIDDESIDAEIAEFLGVEEVALTPGKSLKPAKKKTKKPSEDWFSKLLEFDHAGNINPTLHNVGAIIINDPRMFGAIAYNELRNRKVVRRTMKLHSEIANNIECVEPINGTAWQDIMSVNIRAVLEAPNGKGKTGYGLAVQDRNLFGGIDMAANKNKYHPIKDYLEKLKWDGKPRIATLFQRYLGSPDTVYTREVAEKVMLASVMRIYEPGCKFDFCPVIEGGQGSRKSTFIKYLYLGENYFGELDCRLDDKQKIAETVMGKWVLELPEMTSFHKSDHNDAKAFLRRQQDDVRLSYGREVQELPRQFVTWATTNDKKYLKDPTGNRSYWPLPSYGKTRANPIDTDKLLLEREQLWAEAYRAYALARRLNPHDSLDLSLSMAADAEAVEMQEQARSAELHEEWAEKILSWSLEPIRLSELYASYDLHDLSTMDTEDGHNPEEIMVLRSCFTREDVLVHALGFPETTKQFMQQSTLTKAMSELDGVWENKTQRRRLHRRNVHWHHKIDAKHEELARGWVYLCTRDQYDPDTGLPKPFEIDLGDL